MGLCVVIYGSLFAQNSANCEVVQAEKGTYKIGDIAHILLMESIGKKQY